MVWFWGRVSSQNRCPGFSNGFFCKVNFLPQFQILKGFGFLGGGRIGVDVFDVLDLYSGKCPIEGNFLILTGSALIGTDFFFQLFLPTGNKTFHSSQIV
jgi:hypothetical protein